MIRDTSRAISESKRSIPRPSSEVPNDDSNQEESTMMKLAREGGVPLISYLLSKAITDEINLSDNIQEWTFQDIARLPKQNQEEWKKAYYEELDALKDRKVYDVVDLPQGQKIIKCCWVFDQKTDGRKKARLVAKGFSQIEGIDFNEIFSPVVRFETVRLILALSALENWYITGLDVKSTFLYGKLDEEIYIEQPEGFKIKGLEHKVLCLHRAIYGLKQAALAWWKQLTKSMKILGFKQLTVDAGVFIYLKDNETVIVVIYIDDALFIGKNKLLVNKLKGDFMKHWECRDLGDFKEFLRMNICRERHKIFITQTAYLDKVLKKFNMFNAQVASTPLPEGYQPMSYEGTIDQEQRSRFQSVISSLLYIMLGTRPDIAYAVTRLSQFSVNPSKEHLDKALYICRYLAGTRDYALIYDGTSDQGLEEYTDADWGSNPTTRRSTTGFFFLLAKGIISWRSRAQKTVALSSTEAEYMALSDGS